MSKVEDLSYRGESSSDVRAFERYREDVQRGKGLLQLLAVKEAVTPEIRKAWSPRTFTSINTPQGTFDEVVCTISYHFQKHGAKYGRFSLTRVRHSSTLRRTRVPRLLQTKVYCNFPRASSKETAVLCFLSEVNELFPI